MQDNHIKWMRWFLLVTFSLCLLVSIGISVVALIMTKNLVVLSIPTPLLVAMRPINSFLFPKQSISTVDHSMRQASNGQKKSAHDSSEKSLEHEEKNM